MLEIQAQWAQSIAEGTGPSTRYGYVRREKAKELAIFGRGLDALDKPEYQAAVTSVQFHFVTAEAVVRDLPRLARFHGLTSVTFANNQIFTLGQLGALRQLPAISSLTIKDNPICTTRSALRASAIWLLPGLLFFNGQAISPEERLIASRTFEPLDRLSDEGARSGGGDGGSFTATGSGVRGLEPYSEHITSIVDDLISHACAVDAKIRAVHDHFEAAVQQLISEAWNDVLAMELTSEAGPIANWDAYT